MLAGALAVAASFLALASLPAPARSVDIETQAEVLEAGPAADRIRITLSTLSFTVLLALVLAGFVGSRDPLSNPLPLTIWTLLWVGLTLMQGLIGDLWWWINPWHAPYRLAARLLGRRDTDCEPMLPLPARLDAWPAFVLLLAFCWFELVYPAPDDPYRLAWAVLVYWLATLAAMLVFGFDRWSARGEFLSVFFGMIGRLGVVELRDGVRLCIPGIGLAQAPALALGGTAFLLAALASVSFDGLSKTFFWLGLEGVNPLEYPGRTALLSANTAGLALAIVALSAVFVSTVALGERLAGGSNRLAHACGTLVWSLVPIALAYHAAHYLTALLVNGQYALVALSDPFSLGWNLFGTAHMSIGAGIVSGSAGAKLVWNLQAAAIVAGHVVAVLVAHRLAFRLHPDRRDALLSQGPLTLLMIGYTVFGLWLLSTPTAG